MADNTLYNARDRFLDRYQFEGDERDTAARDLSQFAGLMLRIASRIARERKPADSPE